MASSSDDMRFLNRQLAEFVIDELNKAIPIRNFGRVRKSFNSFLASSTFVRIFSIYHFVRAWNDGRGPIHRSRQEGPMIFFPDIRDDPRVAKDYPRTPSKRNKISADDFRRARKAGTVSVAYNVGPVEGEHFIEEALEKARPKVRAAGLREIRRAVRSLIKTSKLTGTTYISL